MPRASVKPAQGEAPASEQQPHSKQGSIGCNKSCHEWGRFRQSVAKLDPFLCYAIVGAGGDLPGNDTRCLTDLLGGGEIGDHPGLGFEDVRNGVLTIGTFKVLDECLDKGDAYNIDKVFDLWVRVILVILEVDFGAKASCAFDDLPSHPVAVPWFRTLRLVALGKTICSVELVGKDSTR